MYQKGFKYRLYPNQAQQVYLARVFGSCRYVYNRLLSEIKLKYEHWKCDPSQYPKPVINQFYFQNKLPHWKQEPERFWLNDVPAQSLQAVCKHAITSFKNFFENRTAYPKFKKRGFRQSAHYTNQSSSIREGKLFLSKCPGLMRVAVDDRGLPPHFTECIVSRETNGKYFVSFTASYTPEKTAGQAFIGIDMGLTDLMIFSNGRTVDNPRHYVRAQRKLTQLQRRLAKKQKSSKNRQKARLKLARAHERIRNLRAHTLHTLTTTLVREHQAIGIEDLNVKGMMRNHRLAKHIADASWGEIARQLMYKAHASQHCVIVRADTFFPSTQLCSCCGKKPVQKLKLYERRWTCLYCGSDHHRDVNAAQNLERLAREGYNELQQRIIEGKIDPSKRPSYVLVRK